MVLVDAPSSENDPMHVRREGSDELLDLEIQPLGRGGEAAIFPVIGEAGLIAKIYHRSREEYADKIARMLAAPPNDPMAKSGHASIAWPIDRLFAPGEDGRFVGYLMPRIDRARLIYEYYNPRSRQQICPLFHYGYLLRTARNLAAAVRALHEGGYLIGDVNESNILVTSQALVSLVDTDSFQVPAEEGMFRCRVGKPEYTPPELMGARFAEIDRGPEHDAFGLAVLIFQLLMQGTHPFAGVFTREGEADSIPRRILNGYWPYVVSRQVPLQPSPHAPPFEALPPLVQELMRRAFDEGHSDPQARPRAAEWQRALNESEKTLTTCGVNPQHLHVKGLDTCPWCALTKAHGRDPFPSPEQLRTGKTRLTQTSASPAKTDPEPELVKPADNASPVEPGAGGYFASYRRNLGRAARDAGILAVCVGVLCGGFWYAVSRQKAGADSVARAEPVEPPSNVPVIPAPEPAPAEAPFQLVIAGNDVLIQDARLRIPVRLERRDFPGAIEVSVKELPGSIRSQSMVLGDNAAEGALELTIEGAVENLDGKEIVLLACSVQNPKLTRTQVVRISVPAKAAVPEPPKPRKLIPKRKPEILAPDEFEMHAVRGAAEAFVYATRNNKLHILFLQPIERVGAPPPPRLRRGAFPPLRFPFAPPPRMLERSAPPAAVEGGSRADFTTRWVDVNDMAKSTPEDSHPAQQHVPVHVAVIQAAFPYRKQVQALQEACGFDSIVEFEQELGIEFLGVVAQRRTIRPDGQPADGWADVKTHDLRPLLAFGAVPEDEHLLKAGVIWKNDRLLLPRPLLVRAELYPATQLASIQAAVLEADKEARNGQLALVRPRSKFDKDYDLFEPEEDRAKPGPEAVPLPGTARFVPERCLVRFVDVGVQPGQTYEYRLRVRIANPLHNRADVPAEFSRDAELAGGWVAVPGSLTVAEETGFYFIDEDPRRARAYVANPDRVWVQVHRWLDTTPLTPKAPRDGLVTVGDWIIGDHLPAVRGQFIGEWAHADIPVWSPTREQYMLAVAPEPAKKPVRPVPQRGIPIDFTTDVLLVDFRGGNSEQVQRDKRLVRDSAGVEALLMTPDGKLRVRRRPNESETQERRQRHEAYQKLLQEVRNRLDKRDVFQKEDPFKK
jgi:hypothetical protein